VDQNETSSNGTNQHSRHRMWVEFSLPLLIHMSSHFFLGAGPSVFHELIDQDQYDYENEETSVGVSSMLGGWL
jgi:hypothetical protein